MTDQSNLARGRSVVERWCVLAEQRLDYLTELYDSGRWRRFHTERDFLDNVQEAKRAVTTWRGLLNCEAGPNNRPIDLSWLGGDRALPARRPVLGTQELPPAMPRSIELPPEEAPPVAPLDCLTAEANVPAKPASDDWHASLDLAVMQQRYPLLRTSL